MFFSVTNLYSVLVEGYRWYPCGDKEDVQKMVDLAKQQNLGFKVVTVFNGRIESRTHHFAKRFKWGGWGWQ